LKAANLGRLKLEGILKSAGMKPYNPAERKLALERRSAEGTCARIFIQGFISCEHGSEVQAFAQPDCTVSFLRISGCPSSLRRQGLLLSTGLSGVRD